MDTVSATWELGSEFHWMGLPHGPFLPWPEQHQLYATGRAAFMAAWEQMRPHATGTLYVPDYFCEEVVSWWRETGVTIRRYLDGPHRPAPVWDSLTVATGDTVLAVNYFGTRSASAWGEWRRNTDGTFLVEDHSHDPLSLWARTSTADYAFASLRKTYPSPDGALLWSPRSHPVPAPPHSEQHCGSALKLAAMVLKRDYLHSGGNEQVKQCYRTFQIEGETSLADARVSAPSPWSSFLLSSGYPSEWRERREQNVSALYEMLDTGAAATPLWTSWPEGHCPFNAIVRFETNLLREQFRTKLLEAHIYPAIHWHLGPEASAEAAAFADCIMTIPADQRYTREDMKHVATILSGGTPHA